MAWKVSRYRTGDWVEVRSKQEILATLDENGCLERMPFMPEMAQYCGQRFQVGAVAHKTCDTVRRTGGRRLQTTVHLQGVRCDGSAHGGCQASCYLFWKDAWLNPASAQGQPLESVSYPAGLPTIGCSEERLCMLTTRLKGGPEADLRYVCQATQLYDASQPLRWWHLRQYVLDVKTGNASTGRVVRLLGLALVRRILACSPVGYRALKALSHLLHNKILGRPSPEVMGRAPVGVSTPLGNLNLQPGERVRIKPLSVIEESLDQNCMNRGLFFDEEMSPFCGGKYTVQSKVTKLIDEQTGKMLRMKHPCIVLKDVVCKSECHLNRLTCPRAIPPYWRELWLERVLDPAEAHPDKTHPQSTGECLGVASPGDQARLDASSSSVPPISAVQVS